MCGEIEIMSKTVLKPDGLISVPVFVDNEGNEYICLSVPKDLQSEKGHWIYQRVKRTKEGVMTFIGTLLEVYDEDMISIQLNFQSSTLFEQDVEID